MATLLAKVLELPASTRNHFDDDDGSVHEASINRVADAGITTGCAVASRRFCPGDPVSRAQMATFLARAFGYPPSTQDFFDDDAGSPHEPMINAIAQARVTTGCASGPRRYCPSADVRRDQMASFIGRALEEIPDTTPSTTTTTTPSTTTTTTPSTTTTTAPGGGDVTAPELVSLSASPLAVDVTDSDASVTMTAQVTDAGSGTAMVNFFLSGPAQTETCGGALISGTAADGVWQCDVIVQQGSGAGTWDASASFSDALRNGSGAEEPTAAVTVTSR